MARLVLRYEGGESEYQILGVVTIGRQATNDIPVMDEKASRHHARVVPSGSQFFVEDLGSSNGTLLNGAGVDRHVLRHGDVIRIGEARLMFYEDRASNLEGETVGNYRIHKKIGQGGMGTVYEATQISMARTVAIKLLNDELTRDRDFLSGFLEEARTTAKLSHPNVVRVHDFGETGGTYFFSMEFVDGESVDKILRREGKIPVKQALEIVRQVAGALDHAHAQGVIHRDIKPQNILVASSGTVKLTDLGLAALRERRSAGALVGTPDYMPPEIAQQRSFDSRADIYQLGATLFHMVTGRVPYEGADSVAVIARHVRDPIPSPKQYDVTIPDSVCRLIETMMSKNPAMRPSPVSVMIGKIDDILKKDAAAVEKSSRPMAVAAAPPPKSGRAPRRRVVRVAGGSPMTYALMGALVVAILAVVAFVFMGGGGERRPVRRSRSRSTRSRSGGFWAGSGQTGAGPASEIIQAHVDPEAAARAAARAERQAAERLAEIEKQIADNPRAKLWIGRSLYRLIMDYPRTEAALKARKMYRECVGEERAKDLMNEIGPGGGESPAGPVDKEKADDAFNRARLASLKAEADGDYRAARRALVEFTERHGESRWGGEARELRERLDARIHRELDRIYKRAEAAAERSDFRQANSQLKEIITRDPVGPDRKRARELLQSNEAAAAAEYEQALADAAPHFRTFAFDEATRVLKEAEPRLGGTGYERQLATAITSADLGRGLLARAASKFELKRSDPPLFERLEGPAKGEKVAVLGVSSEGARVRDGPAERTLRWGGLAAEELVSLFELVPLTSLDRLALGGILSSRGSWLLAHRQLESAGHDAVLRSRTEGLRAQVDRGMKTERFDFSHFDQGAAWRAEGDSRWSVRGGAFVHEDSGVGAVTLTTRAYRAAGLFVTFEVVFLDDIGAIEVEIGSGDDSAWFSLGSSGYEARCAAAGQTAEVRGEWPMMPRTRHVAKCFMTKDSLSVSIDAKKLPVLKAPVLGRIRGNLTFRAQGAKLELDNVEVRQVR